AAAARGLDRPELANLIGTYLHALAEAGEAVGGYSGRPRQLGGAHRSSQRGQGFQLSEIVDELTLLGRCISESWSHASEAERPPSEEVQRLYAELHLASVSIAEMFTRHMLDDEQTDKRYRRMLQALAARALHP